MDWGSWVLAGLTAVIVPGGSWLIGKTVNIDKRITAHEEVDKVRFDNIDRNLIEVKSDVKTVDSKLDRLIERFL
jgi:hypothetical protein